VNIKRAVAGLQHQVRVMRRMIETIPETHMRFGYVRPDGSYEEPTRCADWCYACKLERLQTGFDTVRATNRRLNRRTQKLESELTTYRRAVDQWQITENGAYVPLHTIAAIYKAAGHETSPRWAVHFERVAQLEARIKKLEAQQQPS
jgi:hypothetical protein